MGDFDTFQSQSTSDANVNIPPALQLTKFAYARCKEIEIMKKSLATYGSMTKLAFQKLPRHMRRRAMSHNVKRLPRRLREIHLNQMKKSGLPPKLKRPSRKYRRKPGNLLQEYKKRQSKINWLNTHIWHAKRFHMIEKWGYKLPHRPCDKAFTACYRATKGHCLLQDISYFHCIEICGSSGSIASSFKRITREDDGLSIGSKAYVRGSREGKTTLYEYRSFPPKPLGIVEFLWRAKSDQSDKRSILWIWVHTAFYEKVLKTLLECFDLVTNEDEKYFNNDSCIQLKELQTKLNRFRLSGNLSNTVIQSCFKIYNSESSKSEWFKEFDKSAHEVVVNQNNYWNELKLLSSTNILPPHIILPLIVHDPRMGIPIKQDKCPSTFNMNSISNIVIPSSTDSPLWNEKFRECINSSKVSNSEIAKLRSNILIPATDIIELGYPVPVILIQKPGNRRDFLGYSSGWDIILPSSWSNPIWISLIMCGARAGGLREFQQNTFEIGKPDLLYPDTSIGAIEENSITEDCKKAYFKKPPNKRTNFNKFKIVSPFQCNWKLLIENWLNHTIDNFVVIRDRRILTNLQKCLAFGKMDISLPDNCLIPVQVECEKGVPKRFAIICIPKKMDLNKHYTEPICADLNQRKRKALRDQHKTMLKRLRQRRRKDKQLEKQTISNNSEALLKYSKEMRKLWLPDADNIRFSCSREVIGFVRDGGFSYIMGHAKGIGYIAGAAVNALMNHGNIDKVLIRNTNSRCYYIAKLSIINEM